MTPTPTLYSQGLEQPAILSALKGITGRYLEIGAFHPKVFSNCRALFEEGWSGVMVEPGPSQLKAIVDEYGNEERISIISAAIGAERGTAKLFVTDDAVSTTDLDHFQKWRGVCAFNGSIWVPTLTIADILNQFGSFEFVSIDAESASGQIFRQLFATEMQPKCVCVEHDGEVNALAAIVAPKGYRKVFENGENVVFAR